MRTSRDVKIDIDMDQKCRICDQPGATQSGVCLSCIEKKIIAQNGNAAQVKRLLQLLKDLEGLDSAKHEYLVEYRRDRDAVEKMVNRLREEIENGQKELFQSAGLEEVSS